MAQTALGAAAPLRLCARSWLFSFLSKTAPQHFIPISPFSSLASRRRALRPPNIVLPRDDDDDDDDDVEPKKSTNDDDVAPPKKSRNELKREARRSVKWGMELAKFSNPQIKRLVRAATLDEEVYDAVLLVKGLGPDAREGKRRQFNYIGRLLREAQPEVMEGLIQASKDGDIGRLQLLSGGKSVVVEDEDEDDIAEEEGGQSHIEVAERWLDGLIYKDQAITKEVYSINNVEFDRQELRKLVRRAQSAQGDSPGEASSVPNDSTFTKAKKPLLRFLRSLARESLAEQKSVL